MDEARLSCPLNNASPATGQLSQKTQTWDDLSILQLLRGQESTIPLGVRRN